MTNTEELIQNLDRTIASLQAFAINQIKGRLDRARTLEELQTAIRDYTRTMDHSIIKACDKTAEDRRQLDREAQAKTIGELEAESLEGFRNPGWNSNL